MPTNEYTIKAETKGFKKAGQDTKKLGGGMKSLAKSVGGVALAYFSAQGLLSGLKAVIKLTGEQELAEKKLATAFRGNTEGLKSYARELQRTSRFGDEVVMGVMTSISAFNKDEEAIKSLTKATLDLAEGTGMDLKSAGDLVSKSIGSSTNALSRYGIEVVGAVGSTERLDSMLGNISDKFEGQASASAQTMTGQIEQMKNVLGDLGEDIGELVIPTIVSLAGYISDLTRDIQRMGMTPLEKLVDSLESIGGATDLVKSLRIDLAKEKIDELGDSLMDNDKTGMKVTMSDMEKVIELTKEEMRITHDLAQELREAGKLTGVALENQIRWAEEDAGALETARKNKDILMQIEALQGQIVAWKKEGGEVDNNNLPPVPDVDMFDAYRVAQQDIIDKQTQQSEWNQKLIEEFPELAESMGLVKKEMGDQLNLAPALSSALTRAFDPDMKGSDKTKAFIVDLLSAMQGVVLGSKAVNEAMSFMFAPGIGLPMIIASLVALEGAKAGVRAMKFEQGGLIQGGSHTQGGVNINAEGGEFVMRRDAVEKLGVPFMESINKFEEGGFVSNTISTIPPSEPTQAPQNNYHITLSGNVMTEDFAVDQLVPAIDRARREGLA